MGPRRGTPASAAFTSASRSSGHQPMNFVVICRFEGGLQAMRADGRSRSSSASSAPITSGGRSIATNRRTPHL
jgi:hypothetical protein